MARVAQTNVSLNAIKGILGAPNFNLSDICKQSNINEYAFYNQWGPRANPTTKEIELVPHFATNGYKLGDFRGYLHEAVAATSGGNRSVPLYEGTHDQPSDTVQIEFQPEFHELNYKRLNASINTIGTQLYSDSGYSSVIGIADVHTIVESTMSPAPPTGHSVTQTKTIQAGSNNWPLLTLTNPWSYSKVYAEIFLTDAALNDDYGHPSDWQVEVTLNKIMKPRVSSAGITVTGSLNGKSASDIYLGIPAGDMADQATSFNFTAQPYWHDSANSQYWPIQGQFTFKYLYGGSLRTIQTVDNTSGGPTGEFSVTGNLYNAGDGTDKLLYGETRTIEMNIDSHSGYTQAYSYPLPPTTQP
jgi:hypothetical protein